MLVSEKTSAVLVSSRQADNKSKPTENKQDFPFSAAWVWLVLLLNR